MIALLALIWCLGLLMFGIANEFPLWAVMAQLVCVLINVPGTLEFFGVVQ